MPGETTDGLAGGSPPPVVGRKGPGWLRGRPEPARAAAPRRVRRERVGPVGAVLQFLLIALVGGLGSAWYMIERGGAVSTRQFGPWVTWINAWRPDVDPYTRAHLVRSARLALHTSSLTFEAKVDDDGELLHSACEYAVEGPRIEASWWSLAVFTHSGRLIENRAERHMHSVHTALPRPDGALSVVLAREARPGNWLPTAGGGNLVVVLTIAEDSADRSGAALRLPSIRRVACR